MEYWKKKEKTASVKLSNFPTFQFSKNISFILILAPFSSL